ncbi:MAG: D-inositol-3-phosphate glycosyltransferase [Owenweeksia sp. TMED14]|nr:MAG: D-inositol-3-phosphate glycosyltransferase [Owenweeksia sp. TMED14]
MNILFFARKTLLKQPGGDSVQVLETIKALTSLGHNVKLILRSRDFVKETTKSEWDVVHSINLGRIVDQYLCYRYRKKNSRIRWIISSILVDYEKFESKRGVVWKYLPNHLKEFIKIFLRAIFSQDRYPSIGLISLKNPIMKFAWTADSLIATTSTESERIKKITGLGKSVQVISPGLEHLQITSNSNRKGYIVLGRIEGIKNQIAAVNAWRILSEKGFKESLTLIGDISINHKRYGKSVGRAIKKAKNSGAHIDWIPAVPKNELPGILSQTYAVIIPSLFETFGLTAIEGLQAKCQVILSENAESASELNKDVFLCSPTPEGIAKAVLIANEHPKNDANINNYSWKKAAKDLEIVYKKNNLFIAFSGSRGMPNRYGGYEEMVDHVSRRLSDLGNRVWVSTSSCHPEPYYAYPGIFRKTHWDPEKIFGSFSQFIYDWISLKSIKKWQPDAHITLGTTSSGLWLLWFSWILKNRVAVHLDGIEWKRGKYSPSVKKYLRLTESWAVKSSDSIISDNPGITQYCEEIYNKPLHEISYGAITPRPLLEEELTVLLDQFQLKKDAYALIICRLVPENNILEILNELLKESKVAVVGFWNTKYAKHILKFFKNNNNLISINSEFDPLKTQALRQGATLYVHGHSVGGTNPGLLQAMAASCRIAAHDNIFNRSILGDQGVYFNFHNEELSLKKIWFQRNSLNNDWNERLKIHNWDFIADKYYLVAKQLAKI